jgi:hypothetical protein
VSTQACSEDEQSYSAPDSKIALLSCSAPVIKLFPSTSGGKLKFRGFCDAEVLVIVREEICSRLTSRFDPYKMAWVMIDLINVARPVLVYRPSDFALSNDVWEAYSRSNFAIWSISTYTFITVAAVRTSNSPPVDGSTPRPSVLSVELRSSSLSMYSVSTLPQQTG